MERSEISDLYSLLILGFEIEDKASIKGCDVDGSLSLFGIFTSDELRVYEFKSNDEKVEFNKIKNLSISDIKSFKFVRYEKTFGFMVLLQNQLRIYQLNSENPLKTIDIADNAQKLYYDNKFYPNIFIKTETSILKINIDKGDPITIPNNSTLKQICLTSNGKLAFIENNDLFTFALTDTDKKFIQKQGLSKDFVLLALPKNILVIISHLPNCPDLQTTTIDLSDKTTKILTYESFYIDERSKMIDRSDEPINAYSQTNTPFITVHLPDINNFEQLVFNYKNKTLELFSPNDSIHNSITRDQIQNYFCMWYATDERYYFLDTKWFYKRVSDEESDLIVQDPLPTKIENYKSFDSLLLHVEGQKLQTKSTQLDFVHYKSDSHSNVVVGQQSQKCLIYQDHLEFVINEKTITFECETDNIQKIVFAVLPTLANIALIGCRGLIEVINIDREEHYQLDLPEIVSNLDCSKILFEKCTFPYIFAIFGQYIISCSLTDKSYSIIYPTHINNQIENEEIIQNQTENENDDKKDQNEKENNDEKSEKDQNENIDDKNEKENVDEKNENEEKTQTEEEEGKEMNNDDEKDVYDIDVAVMYNYYQKTEQYKILIYKNRTLYEYTEDGVREIFKGIDGNSKFYNVSSYVIAVSPTQVCLITDKLKVIEPSSIDFKDPIVASSAYLNMFVICDRENPTFKVLVAEENEDKVSISEITPESFDQSIASRDIYLRICKNQVFFDVFTKNSTLESFEVKNYERKHNDIDELDLYELYNPEKINRKALQDAPLLSVYCCGKLAIIYQDKVDIFGFNGSKLIGEKNTVKIENVIDANFVEYGNKPYLILLTSSFLYSVSPTGFIYNKIELNNSQPSKIFTDYPAVYVIMKDKSDLFYCAAINILTNDVMYLGVEGFATESWVTTHLKFKDAALSKSGYLVFLLENGTIGRMTSFGFQYFNDYKFDFIVSCADIVLAFATDECMTTVFALDGSGKTNTFYLDFKMEKENVYASKFIRMLMYNRSDVLHFFEIDDITDPIIVTNNNENKLSELENPSLIECENVSLFLGVKNENSRKYLNVMQLSFNFEQENIPVVEPYEPELYDRIKEEAKYVEYTFNSPKIVLQKKKDPRDVRKYERTKDAPPNKKPQIVTKNIGCVPSNRVENKTTRTASNKRVQKTKYGK